MMDFFEIFLVFLFKTSDFRSDMFTPKKNIPADLREMMRHSWWDLGVGLHSFNIRFLAILRVCDLFGMVNSRDPFRDGENVTSNVWG